MNVWIYKNVDTERAESALQNSEKNRGEWKRNELSYHKEFSTNGYALIR
ncbi:hypothetical protein [Ornithinibacillus xuwenensis]|uniref:Uncharacterized protein n=1 Tax=Ornithinibacillus xuwenensis TaxID=3144668 RepID=A0ABU9XHZ9_9BACI